MNWIWCLIAYFLLELIINVIFHFVNRKLGSTENRGRSIFKGVLERLFLIIGLLAGYPQVIIAFGAIKIGTRFQKDSKISNDYFIIGNFTSLLAVILFVSVISHFFKH